MSSPPLIRFDDGAAYEEFMGAWSRLVGVQFLRWLAPARGGRWVDVGCGNGAFTELVVDGCAPAEVVGIDPSAAQVDYARRLLAGRPARFDVGEAGVLPYADDEFDAAVMALVVFFVPDPAAGVREMARVVRAGGSVSAYAWDLFGAGFPYAAVQEELSALGQPTVWPPSPEASRLDVMRTLWSDAGLVDLETHTIRVERTFADFDAYWRVVRSGPRLAPVVGSMNDGERDALRERVRARLLAGADGSITYGAAANAIKGRVPA